MMVKKVKGGRGGVFFQMMMKRKFTIISFGILNLLVAASADDVAFTTNDSKRNSCTTTECIHACAFILERLNVDIDPCDNFYEFACGAFLDSTLVPDERVVVDTFSLMQDNIDQQLNSYFDTNEQQYVDGELDKLTHKLYHMCMRQNMNHFNHDVDDDEDQGLKELRGIIEELGGWPLLKHHHDVDDDIEWSIEGAIEGIRKHLLNRTDKIFDITSFIIHIQNANNPYSTSLYRPTQSYSSLREAYRQYIRQTVSMLGNNLVEMREIDDLLDFEYKLNELNYRLSKQSNSISIDGDFLTQFLHIQWLNFFHPPPMPSLRNIEMEKIDKIEGLSVLNEMRNLLNSTSKRTQANFVIWRLIDYAADKFQSPLKIFNFEFNKSISGQLDREQIWKQCINIVKHELPYAIGYKFINNDTFALKQASLEIFYNTKSIFATLIKQNKWIDKLILDEILSKLNTLLPLIAYPSDGFNAKEISAFYSEISFTEYLHTLFALRIIDADNIFNQNYATTSSDAATRDGVDNWKKYAPPTSLSALYSASDVTLRISYSIFLMNIINTEESLKYLNYATVGFIIAREMSRIVNQYHENFKKPSYDFEKCLVEQFNSYQDLETMQYLSGERTLKENIADLMGIKLATKAYKLWNSQFNGKRYSLIGIDFTPNQLFWIAFTQQWCAVQRNDEMERKIKNDIYATERFRVIGMLENAPDFLNDFQCSESSQMNRRRENKCDIW